LLQIKYIRIGVILSAAIAAAFAPLWSLTSRYDTASVPQQPREAALVLGAALWDGHPSPALQERLDMALHLYRTGRVRLLVLSGGMGNDGITEAEGMKRYLMQHGVKKAHLLLENRSTNTRQNLFYSKELLKKHPIHSVYLVTHDYHMDRALTYARAAGIRAFPAPVHSQVLFTPFYKARECLAILKGWLLNR
jgi:uncharacterized SAM-binding protein YcdF (DUF218 family)